MGGVVVDGHPCRLVTHQPAREACNVRMPIDATREVTVRTLDTSVSTVWVDTHIDSLDLRSPTNRLYSRMRIERANFSACPSSPQGYGGNPIARRREMHAHGN